MDSIQDMVKDKMSDAVLGKLGEQFGVDASKAGGLVDMALPMILGGLGKNAQDKSGAEALDKALEKDHDGSILEKVQDVIGDKSVEADGQKILGHVFGDKLGSVTEMLGKSAGTDSKNAGGILGTLAPIVLGQLGKTKKDKGLDMDALGTMLGGEKKQAEGKLGGLMALLDRDNDGSIMDDMLDIGKKFF